MNQMLWTANAVTQHKSKQVFLLSIGIVLVNSFCSYGNENVAEKIRGFDELNQDVARIVRNTVAPKRSDFPKWTLKYNGDLSDHDDLTVSIEPEGAFMVKGLGGGEFQATVETPEKLFDGDGNLFDFHLKAVLMGSRKKIFRGEGGSSCFVTVHFNATGTGRPLNLENIFSNQETKNPRFIIHPSQGARYVDILRTTEAEFARTDPDNDVEITFKYFDPQVGHDVTFGPTSLKTCGTKVTAKDEDTSVQDVTTTHVRRTHRETSESIEVEDTSRSKEFHFRGSITYEPNQYYCQQASIADYIDYRRFYCDWYGTHYAVYGAVWTCAYGWCSGYWWTRDQRGPVRWWFGPHQTTWWTYYWQQIGWT